MSDGFLMNIGEKITLVYKDTFFNITENIKHKRHDINEYFNEHYFEKNKCKISKKNILQCYNVLVTILETIKFYKYRFS